MAKAKTRELSILVIEDELDLLDLFRDFASRVFERVYAASTLNRALEVLSENSVDCIMLDNTLPDGEGIEFVKDLKNHGKDIPSVIITGNPHLKMAVDSVNVGVRYLLLKPVGFDEVTSTLKKCRDHIEEQVTVKEYLRRFDIQESFAQTLQKNFHISQRELEVIKKSLVMGDNQSVADELGISVDTVRKHFEHIFQKLQISSKKELKEMVVKANDKGCCL